MKNSLSLIVFFFISIAIIAQTSAVVRIEKPTNEVLNFVKSNKLEITSYRQGEYIDLMLSPLWQNLLTQNSINYTITQTHEQNTVNLNGDKDLEGYRTYNEVLAELQQIVSDYPEICSLSDIGDSRGKIYYQDGNNEYEDYQHDIWMLKISDHVNEHEDEPAVYYMGAHHAREPISTEVVMGIINHLLNAYGNNDEITNMIDESEIYIVPIVNPDGHKVVLDQLNTNWRKNAADNNEDGVFEHYDYSPDGVDPNRNYGWNWGGEGSSGDPTDFTYRGTSAFSEPELDAMRALMASYHFVTGVSYHSYSELVLWPYAYSASAIAPDHEALEDLGTKMAATIPTLDGTGTYTPDQSNDLYPASGVTDDWAYGEHGIFGILIELATQFIPPASQVPGIVSDNIEAAMILLDRPNHQVLRGHIYDAETLEPIVGEVYIDGIDETYDYRKPYKSNSEFGAYYRLLTEGEYEASFSAYGYIPQSFSDLLIEEDEATILDVYLERASSGPIFGSVIDGLTGENIEGAEITILNTPLSPATTNGEGMFEFDDVAFNNYEIKVQYAGYSTIILNYEISEDNYMINFAILPSEAISFEDGEFPEEFSFAGNLPWLIDENESYNGFKSSVSGNISDSQESIMTLNINSSLDGEFSFYKKVSSESGWDFLTFYLDGQEMGSWSGEVDWSEENYPITEGSHEIKWEYSKDSNTSNGSDRGWVDDIVLPAPAITMVNVGPDIEICHDAEAQLNAFAANYESISWTTSGDGVFSSNALPNTIYTPGANDIGNGLVTLEATAVGSSGNMSDEMTLYVETCLGIEELEANDFRISPNPTSDMINIEFEGTNLKELRIFHISGQLVQHIQLSIQQTNIQLNTKVFGSGVYIVKVINEKGWSVAKRLVVE